MFWKDLQIHSTDRKCGMTTQPSQKRRSVSLVHLWSVEENCTPKTLPWLPPFCFTQDPQYNLVNLPHNQPYNLSKRLWAVIFIEFLIMLLITVYRLQATWACGSVEGAVVGPRREAEVHVWVGKDWRHRSANRKDNESTQRPITTMNKALLVHFLSIRFMSGMLIFTVQ